MTDSGADAGAGRIRVFIACSLDGFIAGEGHDLSWLPEPDPGDETDFGFFAFLADVGALLMGRGTYDVVDGFDGDWPYGERPVLVATHRAMTPKVPQVRQVSGTIEELVAAAREAAGGKDVYIDGGNLIRQALDKGLIDELIIHVIPVVLGRGHPLFAGATKRHKLELVSSEAQGYSTVQLTYRPRRDAA